MLTGWGAPDGIEFRNGQQMAIDEINEMGGILGRPLEAQVVDTKQGGADTVIQAFQRLIDRNNVSVITGGYNLATLEAEYDTIADAGIIYTHTNTSQIHNQRIQSDPDRFFGCFQSDPSEYWYGEGLLKFLANLEATGKWTLSNRKIAIGLGALLAAFVILIPQGVVGALEGLYRRIETRCDA